MYSWWSDSEGLATVAEALEIPRIQPLLYAGQAGATSTRSGKPSSATLLSRVRGQHIRGNMYGSTMRRTFAAVLRESLDLASDGHRHLIGDGEVHLRVWIEQHLRVAIVPVNDPVVLAFVEPRVLRQLDPPLNLDHVELTPSRQRLRELRRQLLTAP
jgi:hypothetical protein